ncbi:MAG: xanthine dehydrogenase family protein molybdopterin-binding subunit [Chloroflexi bacterium]|nr:xanthine dehydrogenase family protein molybdopterin-binding subunit [Chloroflexota bacterium]MCI0578082.1 xanthine dehydrogenase family protein molybdopterin-binding subunit [Chloroflexota bacterium]MCI0646070.1 xanthine dehydrogenase family protein molybdopterin-binding subunit [Chloroflexota bacterium]MCI0730992.1 xanthine dehydrogenase family protein molybdopterin-binding subunit [Chloroflexota bacterium]
MAAKKWIGQPLPRIDAEEKVRGQAIFAADIKLPRMLVGKFLPSPHPHAEILAIDTSQAEALPGVQAVITAADIPAEVVYNPASRFHGFLARPFVVFVGQAVAAVAADDLATAEAALELIEVTYRLLPVVNSFAEALRPDAEPVIHGQATAVSGGTAHTQVIITEDSSTGAEEEPDQSPNVADANTFSYGDVEAAFAGSDAIVEYTYTVPTVHQGYIEPHAVTAHWDRPDHVIVWECVQGAFAARNLIAETLGLPHGKITLNSTEIGGGFGGKGEGIFAPLAVLLAKKAGRPVQLVLTRQEELIGANPAPRSLIRLKAGARQDGTLTAVEADILVDAGAFPTGWIMSNITATLRDNYRFQAWHLRGREILTNKASVTAYRAPGAPNLSFAMESHIDELARRLGIDPMTFRQQNVIREGDLLTNKELQSPIGAEEVLKALAQHPSWTKPVPKRTTAAGLLHGRGLALGSWAGGTGPAGALAILDAGGQFRIVLGTVDLSGSFTSLAQIAADALGASFDQVVISKASPDFAPFAPMSAGSQTIYAMGAAVKEAALDLRAKMIRYVAQDFQVPESELSVDQDGVFMVAQPSNRLSFDTLFQLGTQWFAEYGPLVGQGSAPQRQRAPGYAACLAEVTVDPRTGKTTVDHLVVAQDVGKAINPLAVEGQIQGGVTQSISIALWEELLYDEAGQVRNPSLLDYRMPTARDVPAIETIIVEAPGGDGPFGAKLVGEPPMVPAVAAVANAVTAAIGVRVCDLPITPERVWRAIHSADSED